jgi:hypothetical protein
MKYKTHACGLFFTSAIVCFASVSLVALVVRRVLGIESDFAMFLLVAPVFFVTFWGTGRFYVNRFRLSCPDCGEKLETHYKPGVPVWYGCDNCGYSYRTDITIGDDGSF